MTTRKKKMELDIINPNATGIDVGSRSHFVAVGQSLENVKEFGVYAENLTALCLWLLSYGITSVAMESTGDYWQNLYAELMEHGIDVILCNGKFTKHAKGEKTDVKDCQYIQKLHALGLLTSSFLPDETTEKLRAYCRQRSNLISSASGASRRMQKFLKFLNFRLGVVVKDVCGLTGLAIIEDICKGNLDPVSLANHRHYNCRKSKGEIAKALHANNREDFLFGLKQELQAYKFFQKQIQACDKEIAKFVKDELKKSPEKSKLKTTDKPHKRQNKNAVSIKNFNQVAYKYFGGVDLMAIEGLSHSTVLAIMSEIGPDGFKKFDTSKHFVSWARLAPNNKISGGKVLSSRIPKGGNRLKIALRQAANAIGNLKDTHLSDFFKRVAYRKGRQAAVSATARKLGVIIWTMITKKVPYNPPTEYLFLDQKRKMGMAKRIKKQMAKESEIIFYRGEDGSVKIEVFYHDETFWMTQKKIAELFGVQRPAITKHLKNIFESGELKEDSVSSILEHTAEDGKKYKTTFYNLDTIIALGYRVNSNKATKFRIWATKVLKEFITKGFVLDDERLKQGKHFGKDYFDELLERIREIRASERRFYQKITDIYALSLDYDNSDLVTKEFFATVQNKLHWAITGKTAAEIIYTSADAEKLYMGLTNWKHAPDGKILKSDISIAKNYLHEQHITELNRIVSAYLDLAESRASRQIPTTMQEWINFLHQFLELSSFPILKDIGKISALKAKLKAAQEYDKYRKIQDKSYESDFDREIKRLKGEE